MEFISNNNKAMIWGLLQDSNVFEGIPNNKYSLVQKNFEDVIHKIHKTHINVPLLEKNKMAMNELITKINNEKHTDPAANNIHIEKPLEMVYTSADLQNQRTKELNLKLKEQQESMNTMMNPTKPKSVNFSDNLLGDDKPIGDEMDRLIAEKLASRERELEVPQITKEAENWLNTSKDTVSNSKGAVTENNITTTIDTPTNSNANANADANINANSIFSKLKRKTDNNIMDELKIIKDTQEQLKNTCSQILEMLETLQKKIYT